MPIKRNADPAAQLHIADKSGCYKRNKSQNPQIHYQGLAKDQIIRNACQHASVFNFINAKIRAGKIIFAVDRAHPANAHFSGVHLALGFFSAAKKLFLFIFIALMEERTAFADALIKIFLSVFWFWHNYFI